MNAPLNLRPGQIFNKWKLLEEMPRNRHGLRVWRCRCECGTIRNVRQSHLTGGHAKSCGCDRYVKQSQAMRGYRARLAKVHETHGKLCANCGERKPLDQFWKKGKKAHPYCIPCGKEKGRLAHMKRLGRTEYVPPDALHPERRTIGFPGEKYGLLTIISEADRRNGRRWVNCQCDCGNSYTGRLALLRSGNTKSCGCLLTDPRLQKAFAAREAKKELPPWSR